MNPKRSTEDVRLAERLADLVIDDVADAMGLDLGVNQTFDHVDELVAWHIGAMVDDIRQLADALRGEGAAA